METEIPVLTPPVDMEEYEGLKKNKNDRIDEETSEGDHSDSVIPKVNDAEGTSLTIPVSINKGSVDIGAAEEKDEDNERTDDEMETENPVLTPPVDMEEYEGKKTYNKNDRIDEETSEGENPDSVVPTVNYAEGISLTIPVGIQEGVMKNKKIRMIE